MMSNTSKQTMIYALDFDGVICDSAVELAMSGWQAARLIWQDMPETYDEDTISSYRIIRPIIETGYETILIMRLLQQGKSAEDIVTHYPALISETIQSANKDIATLKQMFGEFRDQWIAKDTVSWLENNPLYPSITEKLKTLEGQIWFIITTKQERFAHKILHANGISIPAERLFGLDRNMNKQAVLEGIQDEQTLPITFVEDRLPTLTGILKNPALSSVHLQLADWGYNTEKERAASMQLPIKVINIEQLLNV